MNQKEPTAPGALQSVRDPSAPAILSTEQREVSPAMSVSFHEEQRELILREVSSLEGELSSLNLRLRRRKPDMDVCGEALC